MTWVFCRVIRTTGGGGGVPPRPDPPSRPNLADCVDLGPLLPLPHHYPTPRPSAVAPIHFCPFEARTENKGVKEYGEGGGGAGEEEVCKDCGGSARNGLKNEKHTFLFN